MEGEQIVPRILIALLIGLCIIATPVFANDPAFDDCCVDTEAYTCGEVTDPASCTGILYPDTFCPGIPECTPGCCCALTSAPDYNDWNLDPNLPSFLKIQCDGLNVEVQPPGSYRWESMGTAPSCYDVCSPYSGGGPGDETQYWNVSGTITDHEEAVIEGATVFIPYQFGTYSDETNASGQYEIHNVPEGEALVVATKEGCFANNEQVTIDTNKIVDLQLSCEDSMCEPDDGDKPLVIAAPIQNSAEAHLIITYEDPCGLFVNFHIKREDKTHGGGIFLEPTNLVDFNDGPLLPETEYCWTVAAEYNGIGIVPEPELRTESCFTTGVAECMVPRDPLDEYWCDNSPDTGPRRLGCLDNNELDIKDCDDGRVCGIIGEGDDMRKDCIEEAPCDGCNGLFGLLSRIVFAIRHGGVTRDCGGSYLQKYCFDDRTDTATNKYRSCGEVTFCEDYHSSEACADNPCQVAAECNWKNVIDELSIGVCQTTGMIPACKECENIYGFCNKQLCESVGENSTGGSDCYWDDARNGLTYGEMYGIDYPNDDPADPSDDPEGYCTYKEDMACRYYDTQTDCTNGGANVDVNVHYDASLNRYGGDHTLTTRSMDLYGKGLCAWMPKDTFPESDGFCYKDSDEKPVDEPEDDCIENGYYITAGHDCLRDHQHPDTELLVGSSVMGLHEAQRMEYVVTDNFYHIDTLNTRFCVDREGICYPQGDLATAIAGIEGLGLNEGDDFHVRFYSWDPSGNLEPLQDELVHLLNLGYPLLSGAELR